MLTSAKPKMMFGRALTGPMLATLVQQYCDALNDSHAPVIQTAWDRVRAGCLSMPGRQRWPVVTRAVFPPSPALMCACSAHYACT